MPDVQALVNDFLIKLKKRKIEGSQSPAMATKITATISTRPSCLSALDMDSDLWTTGRCSATAGGSRRNGTHQWRTGLTCGLLVDALSHPVERTTSSSLMIGTTFEHQSETGNRSSSFPINRTLALELPALCNVLINIAACSGTPQIVSSPPASQASPGAPSNSSAGRHTNYSIAASPVVEGEPRSSIMGIGFHRSTGVKLEAQGSSMLLVTLGVISLSKAFRWV